MVTYRHTQMQPSHLFKLREPVIVGFRRHNGHPNEVSHRKYVVTPTKKKQDGTHVEISTILL